MNMHTMRVKSSIHLAAVVVLLATVGCQGAFSASERTDAEKQAKIDALYDKYKRDFPDVSEITATELAKEEGRDDVVVVDVREPNEIAVARIPGAITKSEFEAHRDRYKDKKIVTYCTIGYRSGIYAEKLDKEGFDAENLRGSILSWVHAGEPVVDNKGKETKRVNVYGRKWNLLPAGYEGVW